LNMMAFHISRGIGALIAGVLIDSVGVWGVYLMISGNLALSAVVLGAMEGSYPSSQSNESAWRNARGGVEYVWQDRRLRSLLSLSLLVEAFAFSSHIMLPVMARNVLHLTGIGFGVLSSVGGLGALLSTGVIAYMGNFSSIGKMVAVTAGGFGLFLVLFAVSPSIPFPFPVALVALLFIGAMSVAYDANMGALLQFLVPGAMRGRVMGLYVLTFGFTPLGGVFAGAIASLFSAPIAIGLGGGIVMVYVAKRARNISGIRVPETIISRR